MSDSGQVVVPGMLGIPLDWPDQRREWAGSRVELAMKSLLKDRRDGLLGRTFVWYEIEDDEVFKFTVTWANEERLEP